MTRRELIMAAVIILLVGWWAYQWHLDRLEQVESDALDKLSEHKIDDIIKSEQSRHDQRDQDVKVIYRERERAVTPEELAAYIAKASNLQSVPQVAPLPDAPSVTGMYLKPQEVTTLADKLAECNAQNIDLGTCRLDLVGQKEVAKIEHEKAEKWEKVAKGGSTGKKVLKFMGCAAMAGGGAYIGSEIGKGKGAAIGAAVGLGGCKFAF